MLIKYLPLILRKLHIFILLLAFAPTSKAQTVHPAETREVVNALFREALQSHIAYENLRLLCETAPVRISGTPAAAAAVELTRQIMEGMNLDRVYLQEVMVPAWKRGEPEQARMISSALGAQDLTVTALGLSKGTGSQGLSAGVIEFHSLEALRQAGRQKVKGRIVFLNRSPDQTHYNTFPAYGSAVDQRFHGPAEAAALGAVAG